MRSDWFDPGIKYATADSQAFVGPVFDASLEPVARFRLGGQVIEHVNKLGLIAKAVVDQAGIPDLVQVGVVVASVPELEIVAPSIVSVRDVHRLVQVLDEMNVKPHAVRRREREAWGSSRVERNSAIFEITHPPRRQSRGS